MKLETYKSKPVISYKTIETILYTCLALSMLIFSASFIRDENIINQVVGVLLLSASFIVFSPAGNNMVTGSTEKYVKTK